MKVSASITCLGLPERGKLAQDLSENSSKLTGYTEVIKNSEEKIKELKNKIIDEKRLSPSKSSYTNSVQANELSTAILAHEVNEVAASTVKELFNPQGKVEVSSKVNLQYRKNVDGRQYLNNKEVFLKTQAAVSTEIANSISQSIREFGLATIEKVSSVPTPQTEEELRAGIIKAAQEHKPPITLTSDSIDKLVKVSKELNDFKISILLKKEREQTVEEYSNKILQEIIDQEIEPFKNDIDSYSTQLVQASLDNFNSLSKGDIFNAVSLQLPLYAGALLPISEGQTEKLAKALADKIAPQQGNYAAERLAKQAVKNMRGQDLRQSFSNEWSSKLPQQEAASGPNPSLKPFLQELSAAAYESTQTIEKLPFPKSAVPLSLPSNPTPNLALLAKEMVRSIPEEYRSASKTIALEKFFLGSLENLYEQQTTNLERIEQFTREISPTLKTAIDQSVTQSPEAAADVRAFEGHLSSSIQGFLFEDKPLVSADPALLARLGTPKAPPVRPPTFFSKLSSAVNHVATVASKMLTPSAILLRKAGLQGESFDFIKASEVGKNVNRVMQDLESKGLLVGVSIEKREELRHFIRKQMYQASGVDRHQLFLQNNEEGSAFAEQMADKMTDNLMKKLQISSESRGAIVLLTRDITSHVRQSMQNGQNVPFKPNSVIAEQLKKELKQSGMTQKQIEKQLDAIAAEAVKELKIDSDWSAIGSGAASQVQAALYAAVGLTVPPSAIIEKVISPEKTVQEIASYAQGTTTQLASRATEIADLLEESDGERSNQALIVEHQVLPVWNGVMQQVKEERDLGNTAVINGSADDPGAIERKQQLVDQVTDNTMKLLFPKGLESIPVPQTGKFFEDKWGSTVVNLFVTGDRNYNNLAEWVLFISNTTILPNIFPALQSVGQLEQFLQSVESSHIEALEKKLGISIAPAFQAAKEVIQTQHGEERYAMAYQILVYTLVRTNVQTAVEKQVNTLTSSVYKKELVLGALKQVSSSLNQVEGAQTEQVETEETQSKQEPKPTPADRQTAPTPPMRSDGIAPSTTAYGESILNTVEALLPYSAEKVRKGVAGKVIAKTVGGKSRGSLEKFIANQVHGYVLGALNQNLVSNLVTNQKFALAEQLNALNSPAAQTPNPDQAALQPQLPSHSNVHEALQTARLERLDQEIESEIREIKKILTSQLGSGLKSKLVMWGIEKALEVDDIDEVVDELVTGLKMITDHVDSNVVLEMASGVTTELVELDRSRTAMQEAAVKREAKKPSQKPDDQKLNDQLNHERNLAAINAAMRP